MFTINEVSIELDKIVANVTLVMDDKSELIVNVPVKAKTKEEVLSAILYRETLEKLKYNAAPVLTGIKQALDELVGQEQDSAELSKSLAVK